MRLVFLAFGSSGHIEPYLRFFADQGHDVTWFAYDAPIPDFGVRTIDVSYGASARQVSQKWKYALAGLRVRRFVRREKVDVVWAHFVSSGGLIAAIAGFRPTVLTAHGSDVLVWGRTALGRSYLRYALGRASLVQTVSPGISRAVQELTGGRVPIIEVTHGIDVAHFGFRDPDGVPRPTKLLCTRGLEPVYDPFTILEAFERVHADEPELTLTFAAGGSLIEPLQQRVRERRLDSRVRFLKGYRRADLPRLLGEHDLYVSASLSDGTSISLLEAMAAGQLPIVSRIESNRCWLEDGETGLMFDPGSSGELATRIRQATRDGALRCRAVRANRAVVEARGNQRTNLSRLAQAVSEILGRGS